MDRIKLIVIAGPTASGKTALAVRLAQALHGEVVSADSMQIYKGMDIATAKPTAAEMDGIPHYLLDFLNPSESFSVARYAKLAREAIREIASRGKQPILAGGTGLYLNAVTQSIQFLDQSGEPQVRDRLSREAGQEGSGALLARLQRVDPQTAGRLHPNDVTRIVRALELYETTGQTITAQNERSRLAPPPYELRYIGLYFADRQKLYDRINRRVDEMLARGLVEEARRFYGDRMGNTAVQAIGYKELTPYLEGKCTLEDAVEKLKRETRRYAKRQMTWFRRLGEIRWFAVDEEDGKQVYLDILSYAKS